MRQLRIEINLFVSLNLKQIIYPIKINSINLWIDKINFLGYEIYFPQNEKFNEINLSLQFNIPLNLTLKMMEKKGYIKNFFNGYRSVSKTNYITLNDILVLRHFIQVQMGITSYYSECTDITKLQFINHLLSLSCIMTLTHKHQSSIKKIFKKYEKLLILPKNKTNFFFPKQWKNNVKFINPFYISTNKIY